MAAPIYDNSAIVVNGHSGTSGSGSFTVGNNPNTILVVFVATLGGTISGVTYNGVSMVADQSMNTVAGFGYSFVLINPAVGSNTLAYTSSSTTSYVVAYSFYNAKQSSQPNVSDVQTSNSSGVSSTVTTSTDNCIPLGFLYGGTNSPAGIANNQLTPGSAVMGWDNAVTPAGNHSVSGNQGAGSATIGVIQLAIAPIPPILFLSVSDTTAVTESKTIGILTIKIFTTSNTTTMSENVTIKIGQPTFADFLLSLTTSNYKWLSSTLLTAQQNYNVRPYFACLILDDTVQPNAIIKDASSGGNTQQPAGNGSAVTTPDGAIIAAGFDASNHISFFKSASLHPSGNWDIQTTLDSSSGIINGQNRVVISCSDWINGSYHIDIFYCTNFVNDTSNLQVIQQYSDDGGKTWASPRTITLSNMPNNAYISTTPISNLCICALKPRLVSGVINSGFAFIKPNGNIFTGSNPSNTTATGYDIWYWRFNGSGYVHETQWSQRNVDSNDWTIHSLDSYYLNNTDYFVFSGYRNYVDPANTLVTTPNYSLWETSLVVASDSTTTDVWSSPRSIFSSNSVSSVNLNSFTFPVATVISGKIHVVFRAVTVSTVSQSSQGTNATIVSTVVNYMKTHSYDGFNFSYPSIIVSANGTQFNDDNLAQDWNSYTNQGIYFYILGGGKLWEFIQNNTLADVSNDVVQYTIQESAGQPSSINLQIANQNNIWVGSAPTNPGASAIAKNRKILLHQGYYNASGVSETTARNTYYIDDITQNSSSNSNNVVLTGRDFYKKLKNTVTKYAFGYNGPFFYTDIFDGSTLANWSQVSGNWQEVNNGTINNVIQTTSAPSTDSVITLSGSTTLSYGSLTVIHIQRITTGTLHIYAMYIDSDNWLRVQIQDGGTWSVVRNINGSATSLDSGVMAFNATNTYPIVIKRYDYFKFCFLWGGTGTNNAIDTYNSVNLFANGTNGEYDMSANIISFVPQPFAVGFGCNGVIGTFSYFKHIQFDNSNSLSDMILALGYKSDIKKYDIQNVLVDNFYDKTKYTGTFSNLKNRMIITATHTVLNNVSGNQLANGEFVFVAQLTPTNSASAYGFQFLFRANGFSSPNATYYWHIKTTASGGYVESQFQRLYSATTYSFPAQAADATVNPGSTIGNLNFDLTQKHTYRIIMVDGWMFGYIDGVMVNAWNDNNTTVAYLTTGYWGWAADSNTSLTVYSMNSTAFWKQIQQFSLNPGDDVESSLTSVIQSVRAWVYSNLFGIFKALFLSSTDVSTYTYQNQIFAQGVDASDKEYVSQVTVYGDQVSAVARNTTLMAGVPVKEEVIVDYSLKTVQDCQNRANNELTNNNQYQNQYNPKQTMNVGAELFDSVTIVDTGNNTTGVNSGSRVYAQKFATGGSNGGNEYSVEIDTGNL